MIEPEQLISQGQYNGQLLAESLLDHHFAAVHRLALSIMGDAAEADDVAQEVFISAVSRIDRFEPGTNLKAWLSTLTINLCRDKLRRRKARERWRGLWFGAQHRESRGNIEGRQVQNEAAGVLWAAVDALDEKYRLPVILRYANGYSVREIAHAMGIPEGTVHSRLHHACRKLGQSLRGQGAESLVMELFND